MKKHIDDINYPLVISAATVKLFGVARDEYERLLRVLSIKTDNTVSSEPISVEDAFLVIVHAEMVKFTAEHALKNLIKEMDESGSLSKDLKKVHSEIERFISHINTCVERKA